MAQRPSLSIQVGRRPSLLATAAANAAGVATPADAGSPLHSPHTPANTFDQYFPAMQTPPLASGGLFPPNAAFPGRRALLRRNSSLSSVSSSVAEEDDEDEPEWTDEEEQQVQRVFDACVAKYSLTEAPFPLNGPPPPNFTNMVARAVLRAQNAPGRVTRSSTRSNRPKRPTFFSGSSDVESDTGGSSEVEMDAPAPRWKHNLRSTRLKILALAKERQNSAIEDTPRQSDPDATPKRRKPLARQDSMDFLPDMRNASSISRLGNMLRQPSSDSLPSAPAMMTSLSASGTPPCAPSAFSHTLTKGSANRMRLGRNNSLQTIAGSPSQPLKRTKSSGPSSADKQHLAVPGSGSKGSGALKRMSRIGSESSVLPAPSLARTLSFEPNQRHPGGRAPLGSSRSDPVTTTASSLLTPPPASRSGGGAFGLDSTPPPNAPDFGLAAPTSRHHNPGLTIDAALSLSLKRPQGGLASAFHSPVVGAYPSPQSISPKKKKAKVSTSPVRQPSFSGAGAASAAAVGAKHQQGQGQDPLASGLGLGLGFGFGFGGGDRSSPFVATDEPDQMDHDEHSEIKAMNRPALNGRTGSVTLLDPSAPSSSSFSSSSASASFLSTLDASLSPLTNRHRSDSNPPKLVLTPSLSPSSSTASLLSLSSDTGLNGGLCSAFSSDSSAPGTPSPLSAAFDLNALKLEALTPPDAEEGAAGGDTAMKPPLPASSSFAGVSPTTMVASPETLLEPAFTSFLPPEYVKAGQEAQALRDQFGAFSWARS
ncbi:hypothetical protein JCM6882_009244 [Rhodosporidiobolus microsporus]